MNLWVQHHLPDPLGPCFLVFLVFQHLQQDPHLQYLLLVQRYRPDLFHLVVQQSLVVQRNLHSQVIQVNLYLLLVLGHHEFPVLQRVLKDQLVQLDLRVH